MNFRVEPVNEHGKDPAVMVTLGDRAIILPPFAAREVAIRIIEAAEMAATGEKLLWNVQTTGPTAKSGTVLPDLPAVIHDPESDEQYSAAVKSVSALLGAVGRQEDAVYVTVTGHANPFHAPRDGYPNEFVTVTVYAVPIGDAL